MCRKKGFNGFNSLGEGVINFYEKLLLRAYLLSITVSSSRKAVSARVVWHSVVFPKRFVVIGKVQFLQCEWFRSVSIRLDFHVSHPAQPVIHSFSSPIKVFTEEAAVTSE